MVRTSAAPAQPKSKVHFVSVDFLNEYMCSHFGTSQEGKSIDSFTNNNKLASLGATLVRNYDPLTYPLTDRGKV